MLLWTLGSMYLFKLRVFIFFKYIPRNEITGSYSSSIFIFLRNPLTIFHSDYTNLHFHQHYPNVPVSPHPCQYLLFLAFLMTATLTGVRWYLIVALICISLVTSDIEHFFLWLLAICMSSLEKHLYRSSACFLIGLFFWCWVGWGVHIFFILTS